MPTALSCLQQASQTEQSQQQQQEQHVVEQALEPGATTVGEPGAVGLGAGARPSACSSLWGMGAGKVVTLIKKCLHRDRTGTPPDHTEEPALNYSSKRLLQEKCQAVHVGGGGTQTPRHRDQRHQSHQPKDNKHCDVVAEAVGGSSEWQHHVHHHHHPHHHQQQEPAQQPPCPSQPEGCGVGIVVAYPPGRSPRPPPWQDYPVRNASPNNHVMYSAAEAGQLDARAQREVARQREHQIRLQSVRKDIHLNLPPFIPLSRDGEEGYTQSQRQLTSSHRYKGSTSICPPPNMTIYPVSDSGPPFHSQSDMVLNKPGTGSKAAHRTEPPMSAPPATTDNNNRKSNLNFNYPPAGVGGSQPASRPTSHSQQHASLSLGMYGAGHTGWLAAGSPTGSTAANGASSGGQPTPNGRRSPPGGTGPGSLIGPPPPYAQPNSNKM